MDRRFPNGANKISGHLRIVIPNLQSHGIYISIRPSTTKEDTENGYPKNTRIVEISLAGGDSGDSGLSSGLLSSKKEERGEEGEAKEITGSISTTSTDTPIESKNLVECTKCGYKTEPFYMRIHRCRMV